MADLNFPSSPTLYQQYSLNGQTFVWDGKRWKFTASSVVSISSGSAITSINNLITTEQFFATGDQGSSFNISSFGSTHTFNIPIAGIASTGLVSTLSQSFGGIKTFTNDLIISSSTSSTSPYTGALTISGGVGIGGSLFLSSLFPSSLSGIVVNNGVITSGSWSGSTITEFYGGTGYNSYTKGDILVGAGNTFIKLNVGSDNFVLTALSSSSTGLTWSPTSATGLTTLNGLSVGIQNLSFGYSGSVPAFSSSGSTHTLNIPLAGIASTGLVSTLAQSFAGIKTFTNAVSITDNTGSGTTLTGALIVTGGVGIGNSINLAGSLNFWNPASTYFVSLKSGITTASTIYTLPPYYPSFGQSVLSADTNGNLSWVLVSANAGQGTVATGAQYQIAGYYSGTAASVSGSSTFTNNLATNSVFINHTTASTATTNGALVVSGGVGISGQLSYNTALIGNTGVSSTPTMTFIGTNGDPIKLRVLDDSTLAFSGSQGQLFSINPVLNTGYIFSVNDISGVPLIRANADATVSMAEFAGNVGIGLSNPAFKLQVLGNAGISGTAFISNTSSSISTTSGALTVLGGVGIGGSLYVAGASNISSVIFNAGIIYGTLVGSATSAGFATTSNYSHTSGFGITSGFATTSAYSHQSGYAITSGSSITSGFATTAGLATTATNINVVSALSNASHPILFTPATGSASGAAISSEASFVYNPFTDILSVSGLAVTSGTVATNFSSGALVVAGGVGIGGSLFVNGDLTINGTTTTINSVTLTVDDKNIELGSVSSPSDVTAEGGGITLRGSSDKFINWYTGTGWSSSESWNLASGNTYKINNISVLSATSLGTGVTNSSLTAVGTITTGVWAATAITALYGGTGLVPAFNVGDILYANTSTTWGRLSASSNSGYVLASAGSGVTPTYVAPSTLSVGLATTANYSHQSGYAITSGSSALATTANYAHQSGYAITSGFATTSAYSHQSGYAITSGSSGTATTATYSHLSGFAVTSGLATTANYAHQSGYATTSGLSGLATTATYAHQSGYAITSGSSATATTATYAHQSGFAITSGFATTAGLATTATYAHQSGYGLTSGFAQTATYSSQSGYGLTAGLATSSTSSFINSANTNTSHPIIFAPITGSSSGSGLSINTTLNYNPSTNILYSSGLAVTASTLSTSSSSGALIVTGGIGVGSTSYFRTDLNVGNSTQGRLYFSQATLGSAGTTVIPSMAFIGTTNSPITLSVLPDNSLSFDGSSGQLFSINNNLSTGWIFSINDISGLPIFRANADLTVSMGEYGGNTGIGLSNPSYKLHVAGDTNLSSGYVYRINGNSVLSSSSLGTGITNSNLTAVGTITTGTWSGSAITSLYGGTGYQTYSTGDLLVGTGSTLSKLSVGANNFILVADNAVVGGVKWANVSGVAITNINGLTASKQDLAFGYLGTVPAFASSGNTHTLNIPIAGSGSTGLVSTQAQTFAGQKTFTSAIIGDLVGTATTSGFATTASYAHQSGYGLTSGFATTANYSHQSGYGLTSGFATTANYANQSGYATTSGLATTATYSHQSGYAITSGSSNTSGLATTATNINVVSASTSASHSVLFTPASGTASGAALSTESTFVYNPSTDILSVSGLAVTATTTSTNSGTGALRVAGGVGISGELNLNNNTSTSNFAFFSGSTNQPANVTIQNTFSGSSAASQLTLNNNDSSSFVLIGVGSTNNSFIPAFYGSIIPTNFGYIIGGGGFGANSGGLSVGAGSTLILFAKGSGHRLTLSGTGLSIFANVSSTSTTTGGLTLTGGAGIGGSIFGGSTISAADNIEIRSGKELRFNNVGNSSYTGFKAGANAVNTTYTLPTAFPGSGTSVLQSDTSGTLSWIGIVGLATTATYALQSGYAITSGLATSAGLATTANYAHQSGYAITSGSSAFATTATYAHQSGYAITSGFATTAANINIVATTSSDLHHITFSPVNGGSGVGLSTTALIYVQPDTGFLTAPWLDAIQIDGINVTATNFSGTAVTATNFYGPLTGNVTGTATTATYAHQSGYGSTSGFATTANYAHQSGYAITSGSSNTSGYATTSGTATTATNVNVVSAATNSSHPILFTPTQGTASGTAASSSGPLSYNPFSSILSVSGLAVTAATPSTGFNSGALIVAGGVGIGGSLYVNGDLTINGTTTTINSVTLTVDDKNIELGSVASPSDATAEGGGITLRGSTDKSINWYSGVGWSSSESWNLASGNTFKINGTSILSSSSLGTGVTNSSLTALGIITTGTWSGSTITAYYGGTGYNSYTKGDILVGAGNTFIKLNVGSDNFVLTASSTSATGLTWAQTAATGITTLNSLTSTQQYFATGTSGSGFNISSSGSTHTFNIPIAGTGATGLVSTLAQSFAGVKTFTNDVIISSSTASTFVRNGALQVYGGVGISGQLSFNQAAMGFTGILTNPSIAFIGTTGSPITLSVLADNSLSFEGSSGQLFSIDNNLTTGEIFAVSDISGLPIISAYANQNVTIGEFGGNLGIGLSNPFYKLHVIGSVGFTSNIASTSTSTGTLVVNGGVGIGGSLNANSASSISGVRLDSGIIYGNLVGTATTAGFASTSNYANQSGFAITSGIATTATYAIQSGYAITSGSSSTANTASYAHVSGFAITSGFATTATYAHQSGYAITSGSSGLATTATYAHQSGYAITSGSSGLATTANNINVVSASTSASHPVLFTPATGTASGAALSTESTFVYNPSTDILSVSGLAITSGTASTSPTTGALVVAGGVGIGGTLRLGTQIVGAPNPFIAGFAGSTSGFVSLAIQNTENGILSRSGIQILNNSGWAAIDLFASGSLFANRLTITNNAGSIHYSATDVHNFIVSTLIMAINGTKVSISPTTASTNTTSGALTVSGGVGIGGSVFTSSSNASSISGVILNNGAITNTGTITSTGVMSLSNSSTTALSIKDGSNNTKFNVDTVGGIVSVSSSTTSTNTTSGAFVVTGGVGIGGSLYVAAATAISGVTINAGVITGNLVGTATTSGFASTSSYSHQSGYAITSGSSSTSGYATTSDYSHQSGFAITSGFATTATYAHTSGFAITSGLATTASYAHQSGFAITSGFATTANYSYTSGYGITSGLATTATYAHQSGFALTATTSTNSTFSTLTADTTNATRRLIFSANGTGSTSLYNTSTLFTNPFNSSVGASVFTGSGSVNIRPGIDATSGVSIGNSSGTPYVYFDTVNGRIGINQPTPLYDLHIVGEISATNKSFVIDHPTKANMMLRHGSLEGPENGVYVRGKLVNKNIIQLPEYWLGLVDEETITVSLTPVGKDSKPYIEKIENYKVYVNVEIGIVNCHFVVYGERKDIPKLDVEY